MLGIIDYGAGNLQSVYNAFRHLTDNIVITDQKHILSDCDRIILPGVGAFGKAMENLCAKGFDDFIKNEIGKGKPFMGICLGMQLLLSQSTEKGSFGGLDIIKGKVLKFNENHGKIPQIGWNRVESKTDFFAGIPQNSWFYFVHSYYTQPTDRNVIAGETEYCGIKYCCAIEKDNIFATQFHPEKSGNTGLKLLENFLGTDQ